MKIYFIEYKVILIEWIKSYAFLFLQHFNVLIQHVKVIQSQSQNVIRLKFRGNSSYFMFLFNRYYNYRSLTAFPLTSKSARLHKKWSFSFSISSVNVTKSARNFGFGNI